MAIKLQTSSIAPPFPAHPKVRAGGFFRKLSSPVSLCAVVGALCFALAPVSAFGQTADTADSNQDEDEAETAPAQPVADGQADEEDDAQYDDIEQVIVTGSRIRRSTYTSVSPLQVIHAEVKREAGLIDAATIVQESSASAGTQYDLTFVGFVLDDGPGASTANLRGLGASRTLALINGRRIAPVGVEGAPGSPNLNIVPGLMVQQYDLLLDGASSIYGSDAVAGVTNIILRKDFDGFTVELSQSVPHHSGGNIQSLGARWGRNWDRGFIGVGVEHYAREPVTLAQRPWTAGCERHIEVDEGGRIRHIDPSNQIYYGMRLSECRFTGATQRVRVPPTNIAGWIYYTPGSTNGGWPNFSESSIWYRAGRYSIDSDGDGTPDVDFSDYNVNGKRQQQHLFSEYQSTNAIAYGEYTLEGDANLTPYFETIFGTSRYFADSGGRLQFFPWVPARNPYNLCNPEAAGGVDCGRAMEALYRNPSFIAGYANLFGDYCISQGVPLDKCTPISFWWGQIGDYGPRATQVVLAVRGDRSDVRSSSSWVRAVAGMRGDLPFLNFGSLTDWTFDFSIMHSLSQAESRRSGIREDRLGLALGYYSNDWTPCENNITEETRKARTNTRGNPLAPLTAADAAPGCVPVNLYAPSLFATSIGDFGTAAERDYLFSNRDFDTRYKQTLFSVYATGNLFNLPAGAVAGGIGMEHRIDEIDSIPNEVARDSLLWGYFSDLGAVGDKYTTEFFGEVEMPLLADKLFAKEITVNLSARFTDDQYYDGAWTGSAKLGWRPIDSLLFRATFGTSYRAPNLRDLFLGGQTGFFNVTDPCYVPEAALESNLQGTERTYNPALDPRDAHVLQRCRDEGVDPTVAGGGNFPTYSVEASGGGSLTLDPETSEAQSFGFSWEQPFTKAFDLNLSMSYYQIDIEDTIIEPSSGFIVYDCYVSKQSTGQFCDRITRNLNNKTEPRIRLIDRGFINRDRERVRGVDLNIAVDATVTILDRPVDLSYELTGHRMIERTLLYTNDAGQQTRSRDQGEWFFNEYRAQMALRVDYARWRVSWQSSYIGPNVGYHGYEDEYGDLNAGTGEPFSSTCLGPPTDMQCKDVETAPDYWVHHASLTYRGNEWQIVGGLRNVFDKAPPQVDWNELWSQINNTPRGAGYDLQGRLYFVTASINFGKEQ